jgi:hypothetical protein
MIDRALDSMRQALLIFGWNALPGRTNDSAPLRCWREWRGMEARSRQYHLLPKDSSDRYSIAQELLNDLEELYFAIKVTRIAELKARARGLGRRASYVGRFSGIPASPWRRCALFF